MPVHLERTVSKLLPYAEGFLANYYTVTKIGEYRGISEVTGCPAA